MQLDGGDGRRGFDADRRELVVRPCLDLPGLGLGVRAGLVAHPAADHGAAPALVGLAQRHGERTPALPACATDHLRLTQGRVEGAAGSTYVTYYLQNVGAGTCVLDGHPGFALLRADGSVIQHPADRSGTPRPVQVAPGEEGPVRRAHQ